MIRKILLALSLAISHPLSAQTGDLPRTTPEEEGVPSDAVREYFDRLTSYSGTQIHSIIVMRHGHVIGETYPAPFAPEHQQTVYSCSKTLTALAVGVLVDEDSIQTDQPVAEFFEEEWPDNPSEPLMRMTVRDLLTMQSGIAPDWDMRNQTGRWLSTWLAKDVTNPGHTFGYDSMCSYLLSAIVQRVTGKRLLDFLTERFFTPMNITKVGWELSPEGINTGGWGLYIQPEGMAKVGQLLLQKGRWEDQQLVSEEWVTEMMTPHVDNDKQDDYCYHMWRCPREGAARADGALGQFIYVVPDKDLVVTITQCMWKNDGSQARALWDTFIPQMADTALAANGKAYRQLRERSKAYAHPVAKGDEHSFLMAQTAAKKILLSNNLLGWKTVQLNQKSGRIVMTVTTTTGLTYDIVLGYGRWLQSQSRACPPYSIGARDRFKGLNGRFVVAGSYAWQADRTLEVRLHYVNWISALTLRFEWRKDDVSIQCVFNYSQKKTTIRGSVVQLWNRSLQ